MSACVLTKGTAAFMQEADLKVSNVVLPAGGCRIADKACIWLVAAGGSGVCRGGGGVLRAHVTIARRCSGIW